MKRVFGMMVVMAALPVFGGRLSDPKIFSGTCDASAAVAMGGDLFAVANDEDNVLRFYRFNRPGGPVQTFDLKPLFTTKRKSPEADLEGAARIGDIVFFISSHGRNSKGKPAPERHRLFALKFSESSDRVAVAAVGSGYTNLVADLTRDPQYAQFNLADAAGVAPKAPGGFNIESLAATPAGGLLIGFRSPTPRGRALLAPLLNPTEAVARKAPQFGAPILLDLGGLGLRGMTVVTNGYYLVAGPVDQGGSSRLFFWAGDATEPKLQSDIRFAGSNPEAIDFLQFESGGAFLILSDDGNQMINGAECKTLPESQRQFRAYRFVP